MRIPVLRHRVQLQSYTVAKDEYGQDNPTWTTQATVHAAIEPLDGREYWQARQVSAETRYRVTLRHYDGLTAQWRLLWGSVLLHIESDVTPRGLKTHMVLMCKETAGDAVS